MATSPKALELFDAYARNLLPKGDGFIVSSHFSNSTSYTRYEIVSYNNVKSIYPSDGNLTFQTDGKKLFILIEPQNYSKKSEEPYVRSTAESIPLRFNELECFTSKNQSRIYYSKKSMISYGSFTILKPEGINFSFIFYPEPEMYKTMAMFFEKTFNKEAGIPLSDAKKVGIAIGAKVEEVMQWEFSAE